MRYQSRDYKCWFNSLMVGDATKAIILDNGLSARDVFESDENHLKFLLSSRIKDLTRILNCKTSNYMEQYFESLNRYNVNWVCDEDEDFPNALRFIDNPPEVLYIKGQLLVSDINKGVSIVGSRKASNYGKWVCREIAQELARKGLTIVSGLALGIDGIAHKTALECGARTVAVLGNGLDKIYPSSHRALGEKISDNGALISEYPIFSAPLPHHFPQRNRIISGLSKATIVVEAMEKSGSLITARLAAEQGKEVYAVPGNIDSLYSRGTNRLILDGIPPLLEVDQVLTHFSDIHKNAMLSIDYSKYNEFEVLLLRQMEEGPKTAEELTQITELSASSILSKLTLLEMEGTIEEESGVFRLKR
ncbi:MAG: DNA-protecting protein DprA [Tissierellia bacterium]|nr:DNA-protecting protein DprA [Tissierellia bacterium]